MLFNYTSGLTETFNKGGSYLPGQTTKIGYKLAPALNSLDTVPAIEFGQVVKRVIDANGLPYAANIESGDTASDLYGIAMKSVASQSQVVYSGFTKSFISTYVAGQAISVVKAGYITVPVQNGTPVVGGTVYMRVTASTTNANLPIGGIETAADDGKCVALPAVFESGSLFPMNGVTVTPTADIPTSQCASIFVNKI